MQEAKQVPNAETVSTPEDRERQDWMTRLEADIRAAESIEKSHDRQEEQERQARQQEQQRLRALRAESYRSLERTLSEGKAKLLHVSTSAAMSAEDYLERIQALEKQTRQYQDEVSGLKGKQKKLIEDSQALFVRHEKQLNRLLQQLDEIPSVQKGSIEVWKDLFQDAQEHAAELNKEYTKEEPNFEVCNRFVIAAGKGYQNCYASIITFIDQHPALKQGRGAAGIQVSDGGISADGSRINAEGNVDIGSKTTINNTIINHVYQTATEELGNIKETQKEFETLKTQYENLQQDYKNQEIALASSRESLKQQQESLSEREQAFLDQTAKEQTARIAAEIHAKEQTEKVGIAKAETEQQMKEKAVAAAKVVKQTEEIEKLKAELAVLKETTIQIEDERRSAEVAKAQAEQTSKETEKLQAEQQIALEAQRQAESSAKEETKAQQIGAAKQAIAQAEKVNQLVAELAAAKAAIEKATTEKQAAQEAQAEEIEKAKKAEQAQRVAEGRLAELLAQEGMFKASQAKPAVPDEKEEAFCANSKDIAEITELLKWGKQNDIKAKLAKNSVLAASKELFLLFIAAGEQDQAEAMLKANPELAEAKGTVTDLSGRTFEDITGFQYAVWALDWHMWKMVLKYLPTDKAAVQVEELERCETKHGVHFSFDLLIKALDTCMKHYGANEWKDGDKIWVQNIGSAQWLLPAHAINEYCRQDRSFKPTPDFSDANLSRSLKDKNGACWFTAKHNGDKLGVTFAYRRYSLGAPYPSVGAREGRMLRGEYCAPDRHSICALKDTRLLQFKELKSNLSLSEAPSMAKQ